jgi:hypothetical protein
MKIARPKEVFAGEARVAICKDSPGHGRSPNSPIAAVPVLKVRKAKQEIVGLHGRLRASIALQRDDDVSDLLVAFEKMCRFLNLIECECASYQRVKRSRA